MVKGWFRRRETPRVRIVVLGNRTGPDWFVTAFSVDLSRTWREEKAGDDIKITSPLYCLSTPKKPVTSEGERWR